MANHTYIKRFDGYAAAEKLVFTRNIELCFVEEGEVCCDVELLLGLHTNLFTVNASLPCEVYSLCIISYEKLVLRKNPQTVNLIKMLAETKLMGRNATIPGKKIDILPYLLYRMKFVRVAYSEEYSQENHHETDEFNKGASNTYVHMVPTKSLNAVDAPSITKQHDDFVLNWYMRNKAPFLKPVVHGAVYYKEMMQRRAKSREELRKKYPKETVVCKAISCRVAEAIAASVKEGIKMDRMIQKVKFQYPDRMKRWR